MKSVLIGLSNNIQANFSKIKVWSNSFKKYSDGDIVLLCANASPEELKLCESIGIKTVPVIVESTYFINNKRLRHTIDFLKQSDYEWYLITDVFDVVFQANPFTKLSKNYDIFVGSEGVMISQEGWNGDVIQKVFPEYLDVCRHKDILCSGVIAGKKLALIDLYEKMDFMCENSSDAHNIKDQAALIVLASTDQIPNLKVFEVDDGWTLHCAVGGPTQFFKIWGFRDNLIKRYGGIATLEGSEIFTHDGKKYDIVHQFNRISSWNYILTKDYE